MTEILEIFSRCTTCGMRGAKVRAIEKWAKENDVLYATHKTGNGNQEASNVRHLEYLKQAGLPLSYHVGIVVENTGKITRLLDWQVPS